MSVKNNIHPHVGKILSMELLVPICAYVFQYKTIWLRIKTVAFWISQQSLATCMLYATCPGYEEITGFNPSP